jgi:mannan endo-1,4-beta-mannosidase
MKRILIGALMLASLILAACNSSKSSAPDGSRFTDPQATAETRALYRNLLALQGKYVLFGHQDSLAYGVQWQREADRSDVKDVTGSFPAVYGWDIGWLEKGGPENLDGVSFDLMRESIKRSFERGGITTISWHMINPMNGGSHSDSSETAVEYIIPGGAKHELFKSYLDKFVAFNESLMVNGVQVPIIFRPWHEHNGEWFWWGKGPASEKNYIKLWRFTVEYLRDEKQQHNLIFAFSPDRSRMNIDTMERDYFYAYPGDDYVDVIGFDNYWDLGHPANETPAAEQLENFGKSLAVIGKIAKAKGKVGALTEGGSEAIENPQFWTEVVLRGINSSEYAQHVTWLMVWRNTTNGGYNKQHFYAPYPGHDSAVDFVKFKQDERILFEDELPALYR